MLTPVVSVRLSGSAEACQPITDGVRQGISELCTHLMVNIDSEDCEKHKETTVAERKLKKIILCIYYIFRPKIPEDIADNFLKEEDKDKKTFEQFVETRLKDKTTKFTGLCRNKTEDIFLSFQSDFNEIIKHAVFG